MSMPHFILKVSLHHCANWTFYIMDPFQFHFNTCIALKIHLQFSQTPPIFHDIGPLITFDIDCYNFIYILTNFQQIDICFTWNLLDNNGSDSYKEFKWQYILKFITNLLYYRPPILGKKLTCINHMFLCPIDGYGFPNNSSFIWNLHDTFSYVNFSNTHTHTSTLARKKQTPWSSWCITPRHDLLFIFNCVAWCRVCGPCVWGFHTWPWIPHIRSNFRWTFGVFQYRTSDSHTWIGNLSGHPTLPLASHTFFHAFLIDDTCSFT
jgi:hypothetical protein